MSGPLTGRAVLISGGASGIGRSTARMLVDAGARVLVMDLAPSTVGSDGPRLRCVHGDVRSATRWTAAVGAVEEWAGGLDAVVLNAGVASSRPLLDAPAAELERVLAIDLLGVILGVRAAVPALRRRGGGAIVATSSLAGLIAYEPDPVYAAAKHGVVGLVRSIAPGLQADAITVNAICPGLTDTPILPSGVRRAAERERFALIAADEVARAIVGCVTGTATGQALVCQAGRPPVAYAFRGVPGPRGGVAAPHTPAGLDG